MSLWHCHDRCSGERFEVHGSDEEAVREEVEAYIREGIDADTGEVEYDVTATAIDGSEFSLSGTVSPVAGDEDDSPSSDEDASLGRWCVRNRQSGMYLNSLGSWTVDWDLAARFSTAEEAERRAADCGGGVEEWRDRSED